MGIDITMKDRDHLFRLRASVLLYHEGKLLMARNSRDSFYYSVGGAVQLGESLVEAVEREVLEETELQLTVDRLVFIHENFFPFDEGREFHELCFYFLMHYGGESVSQEKKEMSVPGIYEWVEWVPLEDVESLVREGRFYPSFFVTLQDGIPSEVLHIVTREDGE